VFRYRERVAWATKGSPPNILAVLARVAKQQDRQDQSSGKRLLPVPATSESDKRARLPTGSIPADQPVTPQQRSATHVRTIHSPAVPLTPEIAERISVNREAALRRRMASSPQLSPLEKLFDIIGTKLPTVSLPTDRCVRCAGAMHAGACSEPNVNQVLYNAGCCACCALPVRCVHQSW
jgi:hypothetical protein